MNEIKEYSQKVERLLKEIEILLRGGKVRNPGDDELTAIERSSRDLLMYYSSPKASDNSRLIDNNLRTSLVSLGVKLHNKVRNIIDANQTQNKIRAILRATAAYMFKIYGDMVAKLFAACIKLFSKSGREMLHFNELTEVARNCLKEVDLMWKGTAPNMINGLTNLEVEDIKTALCLSYIDLVHSYSDDSKKVPDMEIALNNCLNCIDGLPMNFRLILAEISMQIGQRIADSRCNIIESLKFLKIALDALKFSNVEDEVDNRTKLRFYELRVKTYLMQSYIYSEMK